MENYSHDLDAAFHALADPTRRAVVSRLMRGPAPVGELAQPFGMGLPSFLKHLKILEESGLIVSRKEGRVRTCEARAEKLEALERWFDEQRAVWESRYEKLDTLLLSLRGEKDDI
jgi:DNA-binding transcriptional ArsR family regulator